MYKISFLMCVRRLAVYLDSCGQLEELKSMEREFDNHDLRKMHKTILSEEKLTIENIFEIIKAFIALNTH